MVGGKSPGESRKSGNSLEDLFCPGKFSIFRAVITAMISPTRRRISTSYCSHATKFHRFVHFDAESNLPGNAQRCVMQKLPCFCQQLVADF